MLFRDQIHDADRRHAHEKDNERQQLDDKIAPRTLLKDVRVVPVRQRREVRMPTLIQIRVQIVLNVLPELSNDDAVSIEREAEGQPQGWYEFEDKNLGNYIVDSLAR